jgi:hypothetical protein
MRGILGLSELPLVLVVGATLAYWSYKHRWRRASIYLLFFLFCVVGSGTFMLVIHGRNFEPQERYSWDGWYWIFFVGGIGAGAMTVVGAFFVLLVKLVRPLIRHHK